MEHLKRNERLLRQAIGEFSGGDRLGRDAVHDRQSASQRVNEPPSRQDAKRVEPTAEADRVAREVVDAAFAVHTALGPGLLESVYEQCLEIELRCRGMPFLRQVAIPVNYRGIKIDAAYRVDLIANARVVIEVKAVEKLMPVHESQLLIYLKLSGYGLGLLINFNVSRIKDGMRRIVLSH